MAAAESKNKLPSHPQELEIPEEKKIRYRSIRIARVIMLIFAIGFSIVLTGIYPYMTEVRQFTTIKDYRVEGVFKNGFSSRKFYLA